MYAGCLACEIFTELSSVCQPCMSMTQLKINWAITRVMEFTFIKGDSCSQLVQIYVWIQIAH